MLAFLLLEVFLDVGIAALHDVDGDSGFLVGRDDKAAVGVRLGPPLDDADLLALVIDREHVAADFERVLDQQDPVALVASLVLVADSSPFRIDLRHYTLFLLPLPLVDCGKQCYTLISMRIGEI